MKEEIKHLSAAAFLFKLLTSIFSVLFHSASHTLYLYHHHTQVGGGEQVYMLLKMDSGFCFFCTPFNHWMDLDEICQG